MNKFFGTALPYAETHYKFKLPWSPLFKKWPEIFIDGPSFCIPGIKPKFYLVIKDADYFPVMIQELAFHFQASGQFKNQVVSCQLTANKNLMFIPLDLDLFGLLGNITINAKITVENQKGKSTTFLNTNYPGVTASQLQFQFLENPLPYPAHWYAGELHCHTDYSNDPVEFGAPLSVLQEAGQALGLGYVVTTDHSYDFYYQKTRYMETNNPELNFQNYRSEALALNQPENSTLPIMIPGEEVSCGNGYGENVHLLVAGFDIFIAGHGDGGRRWFNNKPDLSIAEVLEIIGSTPCFAAHPRVQVSALEKIIFRRGMWADTDFFPTPNLRGVDGLQFWNGSRKTDFKNGREQWVSQLLKGKRLSPIGANDAHGDLNQNFGVKTPLFSLYQNRDHIFGHVRTVVYSEQRSLKGMQTGLKSGKLFNTDGPYLNIHQNEYSIRVEAKTSSDFGSFECVILYGGSLNGSSESQIEQWKWAKDGPMDFAEIVNLPKGINYLRAEAQTTRKRYAITAPIYIG